MANLSEVMHDERDKPRINDELHLLSAPSGYVTQEPDGLLVDLLLVVREQGGEVMQCPAVEHMLRLLIRARHDVAHRSQSCSLQIQTE